MPTPLCLNCDGLNIPVAADCTTGSPVYCDGTGNLVTGATFLTSFPEARIDFTGGQAFVSGQGIRSLGLPGVADVVITNPTCRPLALWARVDAGTETSFTNTNGDTITYSLPIRVNGSTYVTGGFTEFGGGAANALRYNYYGYDYPMPTLAPGASMTVGLDLTWVLSAAAGAFSLLRTHRSSLRIFGGTQ